MAFIPPFNNPFITDDDYDAPDTWPPKVELKISSEYQPLFTSAAWVMRARIDGVFYSESAESDKPHSEEEIKQWARALIRTRYEELRKRGVDALKDYINVWGGREDEIS